MMGEPINSDLLIVGAGPAGAALACFLASHGYVGIIVAAAPGCADTPRAHITNMAALECLRDIGLEEQCVSTGAEGHHMEHTRWCESMAGEEYARIYSWGNDPQRIGDYDAASPCKPIDLPQTELEPILTRRAVLKGWTLRFNTTFLSFTRPSPDTIISQVRDDVSKQTYQIRSRFLFGCDGARSQVVRELKLPLIKKPGQGLATNILVKADLSHLVQHRTGNLHWVVNPGQPYPPWGWACLFRMVRPWSEWMFILLPFPGADTSAPEMTATEAEYLARVKQITGDESVNAEIINTSKWYINEIVAERYSDGNVFCLGDAVHRHPPFNGLGSNTCIQDAFNLAWKVSYVLSGRAGPALLDSFTVERQPVGVQVVTRANQGLRDHMPWMKSIGMTEPDIEKRRSILREFEDAGELGRQKRKEFYEAIAKTSIEFHGLGVEMNQHYDSNAVVLHDESGKLSTPLNDEEVQHHKATTHPGSRLPHAWLNTRVPTQKISTIDLAGHGRFCLLTGPGGAAWKEAAKAVSEKLGVEVVSYSIGWKQDYEDVYLDWDKRREVEEDGCVLVRPDRFVAWRSRQVLLDCASKLESVLKTILQR